MILALLACRPATIPPVLSSVEYNELSKLWPLPAVPESPTNAHADDPWTARLGQALFFEERLSDGDTSCASCHDPAQGWSDGSTLGEGAARHTPSLWNVGHDAWFFWDGRCDALWCASLQPIEEELGGSRLQAAWLVHDDGGLLEAYEQSFGDFPELDPARFPETGRPGDEAWDAMRPEDQRVVNGIYADLGKALEAYERRIVSRDSPFDAWAEGMLTEGVSEGLSEQEIAGFQLFVGEARCVLCHAGPSFSSEDFLNIGLGAREGLDEDLGRLDGIVALWSDPFNGAGEYSDDPDHGAARIDFLEATPEQEGRFKVPGLRGVAESGPYMHGGHHETLDEVLLHYAGPIDQREIPDVGEREDLLLLVELDEEQRAALVAFLGTLTGEPLDEELTGPPSSPTW